MHPLDLLPPDTIARLVAEGLLPAQRGVSSGIAAANVASGGPARGRDPEGEPSPEQEERLR
jgi:hypothetical protein